MRRCSLVESRIYHLVSISTRDNYSQAINNRFRRLLLAKLNQFKVLIQIVPEIVLLRSFRGRKDLGLNRKPKLLGSILALDITLVLLVAGLVVVNLVGVNLSSDEVLPVAMAALDGLGHELGVLVVSSDDLEDGVATGDFVVLRLLVGARKRELDGRDVGLRGLGRQNKVT